jgi:hypothetical protein
LLLLDHSAWSRLLADGAPKDREEVVLDWIEEGRLATCLPFLLEAGFSARAAEDHREIMSRLECLPISRSTAPSSALPSTRSTNSP